MYKCATEEAELISNSAYLTLGQSIKLDTVPDFVCVAIDSEANDLELLLQGKCQEHPYPAYPFVDTETRS